MNLSDSVCVVVVVALFLFVEKSDGLQCYECKSVITDPVIDPCKDASLQECPPNSSCLTARVSIKITDLDKPFRLAARNCIQKRYEDEDLCKTFNGNILDVVPNRELSPNATVEKCDLCATDGCNNPKSHHYRIIVLGSASSSTLSMFLFVGALACVLSRLF